MTKKRSRRQTFRSGLEDLLAKQIVDAGHKLFYETDRVQYIVPERSTTYTPDFKLPKTNGGFFYVEAKGLWDSADRKKHILLREQRPDLDIRFVFSNHRSKIYKGSKTTYGDFCNKHGFIYSKRWIPEEWLTE